MLSEERESLNNSVRLLQRECIKRNAEIERLKTDNKYAVEEFAACAMMYADEIRVDKNGDEIYTIRGSRIDECVNKWFKENEQPKPWEE